MGATGCRRSDAEGSRRSAPTQLSRALGANAFRSRTFSTAQPLFAACAVAPHCIAAQVSPSPRSLIATALDLTMTTYEKQDRQTESRARTQALQQGKVYRIYGTVAVPPELEAVRTDVHRPARKYQLEQ